MTKVFHLNGGGDTGGGMSHLLSLLPRLRAGGVDAQLVVFSQGLLADRATGSGIPVHCLGFQALISPSLLLKLVRFLKEHKPDIVHTHGGRASLYGRLAASMAGIRQVVTTIHSHTHFDYDSAWKNNLFATADRLTWGLADHFIAVSEQLKRVLVRRGIPESKITVILNGIEDKPASPALVEEHTNWAPPVICAIGRLVSIKRFDVLLRALARLTAMGREFTLVLVGDGPQSGRLRQLATELYLEDKVVFAGYRHDAREILSGADVFVMSSDMEGLPIVLLEAVSARVPVVATEVGGIAEVIVHEQSGLLVPPADPDALAAALCATLDNPSLSKDRAAEARSWYERHATAQVMAEQTKQVYVWGEIR